jgi:hypothetical protein
MMVSVSYTDLHTLLDLTTTQLTAAETEGLLDWAIDLLNLYSNAEMSNMSGVAGSKTVTLTGAQRGAVFFVARALYESGFKGVDTASIGSLSSSPVDVLANPTIERLIRLAAKKLSTKYFERA